jgi:SAM-dependent methyltransferase
MSAKAVMKIEQNKNDPLGCERATPSPWVERFLGLLAPGGEILDLACGSGRHTALLAAHGHPVLAVDRDIGQLGTLAAAPGVTTLGADLEGPAGWPLGARRFAGVVVTNYLHRPLLPAIIAAVAPGGLLIYETFALGNERFGRPRNPDFLLRPGELLAAVAGRLVVLAYEHGQVVSPRPAVIQRIAAQCPPLTDFDSNRRFLYGDGAKPGCASADNT